MKHITHAIYLGANLGRFPEAVYRYLKLFTGWPSIHMNISLKYSTIQYSQNADAYDENPEVSISAVRRQISMAKSNQKPDTNFSTHQNQLPMKDTPN